MEENEMGFEDFEAALFDGENHTADDSEAETEETEEETESESTADGEEEAESGEDSDSEETSNENENGSDDGSEPESKGNEEQSFTIKVNKEERTVTLDEMKTLAQKGTDYDRVKEQSAQRQQTIEQLQSKIDGMAGSQSAVDILNMIAEKSGTKVDELIESLYVNFRKSGGASEDAAREELKNARLQKELEAAKAVNEKPSNDADARFQKDMEEFQNAYPDVQLTNELVGKLEADIRSGSSLTSAYRKYEKSQDAEKVSGLEAKVAELERKLAAKEQNNKNKKQSPGSQKDSGGRRTKSDYEEFERALFG